MFLPEPNPIAFTLFGLPIRWYGILIAAGMLIGLLIAYRRAPAHRIKPEKVIDLAFVSIPMGVIGARLYFVLFHWEFYSGDMIKILNIRNGGLAIHGGLLLGFLTAIIFCYLWSIRPLNLLDLMAPSIALAQALGRWGNYFNQEAYGSPTDLPWAILIDGQPVHPTFLYESLWCLLLFVVLLIVDNHRIFQGQTFLLYGILYSLERFFVEWLRTDSLMLGPLKAAQLVSATVFVVFLIVYLVKIKPHRKRRRMFY